MKTVEILKTVVCENCDGVQQVFGIGKSYSVDDATEKRLQELKAIKRPKRPRDEEAD